MSVPAFDPSRGAFVHDSPTFVDFLRKLPDGRLAIATWGGAQETVLGEVYLLDNVTGATDPTQVTAKKIAEDLQEPMGLKYVDGTIYVSEKDGLTALVDTTGDEVTDEYRTIATWPFSGNYHEFAFGMLYQDGYFYVSLGIAMNHGGATADPQPAANRGTTPEDQQEHGRSVLCGRWTIGMHCSRGVRASRASSDIVPDRTARTNTHVHLTSTRAARMDQAD